MEVEIFDSEFHERMSGIWDGRDRYSVLVGNEGSDAIEESDAKAVAWAVRQRTDKDARWDVFEAEWPEIFRDMMANDNVRARMVILDSGVLLHHPRIRPILKSYEDATGGKDPCDRYGHGTMVAFRATANGTMRSTELHSIKVTNNVGAGRKEWLLEGLGRLQEIAQDSHIPVLANLSVGIRSRVWFGDQCRGKCDVCREAIAAAERGVTIWCAPGNTPGQVACPASVPYYRDRYLSERRLQFYSTGSSDFAGGLSHLHSGSGHVEFGPLVRWTG